MIYLKAMQSGVVQVSVADSSSGGWARPRAAIGMELYERILPNPHRLAPSAGADEDASHDDVPNNDPPKEDASHAPSATAPAAASSWRFAGVYTSPRFLYEPPVTDHGQQLQLIARWITRRGERGRFGDARTVMTLFNPTRNLGGSLHRDSRAAA